MSKLRLIYGRAQSWADKNVDLICTNPYGPIPECLWQTPAVISLYSGRGDDRLAKARAWMGGADFTFLSRWGAGGKNSIYLVNMPPAAVSHALDLSELIEDHEDAPRGCGWFPLALPLRLLMRFGRPGIEVWDGFCGRGTVGRACALLGMDYIGIDCDGDMIHAAQKYLAELEPKYVDAR